MSTSVPLASRLAWRRCRWRARKGCIGVVPGCLRLLGVDFTRGNKYAGANDLQLQSCPAVRHHDGGVGDRRHAGRRADRRAADVSGPDLRHFLAVVWAIAAAAHQRGDFRLRRVGAVCDVLLRRAAHLSHPALFRRPGGIHLLGLAGGHRAGRDHAAPGHHHQQGVRGARMADRHPDYPGMGVIRGGVLRHPVQA